MKKIFFTFAGAEENPYPGMDGAITSKTKSRSPSAAPTSRGRILPNSTTEPEWRKKASVGSIGGLSKWDNILTKYLPQVEGDMQQQKAKLTSCMKTYFFPLNRPTGAGVERIVHFCFSMEFIHQIC